MPAVYVIDDNDDVRASLALLLEAEGYKVHAHGSAQAFLDDVVPGQQGCVIAALPMQQSSIIELLDSMRQRGHSLPVIIVSSDSTLASVVEALKHGAHDFLIKPFCAEIMFELIRTANDHLAHPKARGAEAAFYRDRLSSLSPKETAVLSGTLQCKPVSTIASELGMRERSVEAHRADVMVKLGVRNLHDLVRKSLLALNGAGIPA